jgi:hypothetical protein
MIPRWELDEAAQRIDQAKMDGRGIEDEPK